MILNMEFETDQPFDFQFGDWLLVLLDDPNSVKFNVQQNKTDAEKAQARNNIGAAVDEIVSSDNAPLRLMDLPEGTHQLSGFFLYNSQSDEGVYYNKTLFAVTHFEIESAVLIQGFVGRILHSIIVTEEYYEHERKNLFEQNTPVQNVVMFQPDAKTQITKEMLSNLYKPLYYTSLSQAVADLNAGITDNADATAENALCAIYTDYDGNTCLTLLSNIEVANEVTISANIVWRINGYNVNITYSSGYALTLSGNSIVDCRVPGSKIELNLTTNTAVVCAIHILDGNTELIGGEVVVCVDTATKPVLGILTKANLTIIDSQILTEVKGGSGAAYALQNQGVIYAKNTIIKVVSTANSAYAINTNSTSETHLEECEIVSSADRKASYTIYLQNVGDIKNCQITSLIGNTTEKSSGVYVKNTGILSISDTAIFADGTTGSANDASENGRCTSDGIVNEGNSTIKNCTVFGTHSGIQCSSGSTTVITGGLYESCSHGGVYIACPGGNFFAENAIFRNVPYRGKHKNKYNYSGAVYLVAAVYIGGGANVSNVKAYMDNCILDGGGPELAPDGDSFIGAEPVRSRASLGEQNNSIYASNCTFMGDGKIRFGNSSHHLYLGYGNRVLCEANLPDCVDTTAYKNKVFTSYEEV